MRRCRKGRITISFLDQFNNKAVHLLFPFVERFFWIIPLTVILAVWSIPATYWQIRVILFWLWFVSDEVKWEGVLKRDHLPIQPENSLFYRIYRVTDRTAFLILLILLIAILVPGPPWIKAAVLVAYVLSQILRGMGDRKYRPKKPEE